MSNLLHLQKTIGRQADDQFFTHQRDVSTT